MPTIQDYLEIIDGTIATVKARRLLDNDQLSAAESFYNLDACTLLMQSSDAVQVAVGNEEEEKVISLRNTGSSIEPVEKNKVVDWNEFSFAALLAYRERKDWLKVNLPGQKYTRTGMKKRVLEERRKKALKAAYRVALADNIYGEHTLYNEKGVAYKVTLRDFEREIGYIDNIDWRANKLGTTKHIMFLFNYFKEHPKKVKKLKRDYPFVEIYLDPLNDYRITWYYPGELPADARKLIRKYFGRRQYLEDDKMAVFAGFLSEAYRVPEIKVREEVPEKVERFFNERMLDELRESEQPDFSLVNATLYDYQKEGVNFALYRSGAIIADEMGLGKTLQAITTGVLKKQVFGFERALVICPASLKWQWKSEIEKFSDEKATVVEGLPKIREELYQSEEPYFFIINYETVLRDLQVINAIGFDFVILDEAQKIKNYETKTAAAIKRIDKKHNLVITGTPIENKLIDLYSIVQFVDPYFLAPLWEFSYQHCLFDPAGSANKITGYYNLNALKKRMNRILIRREKRNVIKQLPNVRQQDIPIAMHEEQSYLHAGFSRGIAQILRKKFKTPYDWQRLLLLLSNMRMVCNSTFLIDKTTNHSPKLHELRHILVDKLDMRNQRRKIIIFSEWINMLNLIAELLEELKIGYVMLTGKVKVRNRGKLIKQFEKDKDCQIFLSTESGGAGLNLQVADTVINFELPWNPARKNQRIGRIDRLGQKNENLNVINFITVGSIEEKIASGLFLKQNLFDGVLNTENTIDEVDFSDKGKAQFFQQMEEMIDAFDGQPAEPDESYVPNPSRESNATEILPPVAEEFDRQIPEPATPANTPSTPASKHRQLEEVLNQGMAFLSGIYKMTTGQELAAGDGQKIEVDPDSGEVVMRFKIHPQALQQ